MIRLSLVLLLLTGGAHAQAPLDMASAAARIRADVGVIQLKVKTHEQRRQAIMDLLAVATLLAPPPVPVVNGQCSPASGVLSASVPAGVLCSAGIASAVSANSVWAWSCAGSGGGTTAQCSAPCTPTQGTTP